MEIWKEIKGFDFTYLISNYGNVQKIKNEQSTFLKIYDNGIGYKMVVLRLNKKNKMQYVHRLVAKHFLDNPNNFREVNHIDFDKANNNLSNIEWCDRQKNMDHYYNKFGAIRKKVTKQRIRFNNNSYINPTYSIDLFKSNNKYRLRVRINGERKHIGFFNTYDEAINKKISLSLLH